VTRAVLLPAGADPFLNAYWLRHYRTWADSVDELHVATCGSIPDEVVEYTRERIEAVGGTHYHFPRRMSHGWVITYLLEQTSADHIMLIEDDAFIRTPAIVEESFAFVETGETDLIGCPRNGYASESIIGAAIRRFGEEPQGLAFWPCFLFVARKHLEATDKLFDGKIWPAGSTIFGETLHERAVADTFIWASYQLREQGLTVSLRDGHRLGIEVPRDAPWFHVGSLSSGHGYIWLNADMTPERYTEEILQWSGLPPGETAKRMAWWQRAWEHWDGGIPDYRRLYELGFREFVDRFNISQGEVDYLRMSWDYLVTWTES